MRSMKTFEVICPVYNEQEAIPLFFARIEAVFKTLGKDHDCRLVFIDNCSVDRSQELVRALCERHGWVSLVVMSRNFGYQCSVECGIRNSTADLTGVVDVDCEDPPELFVEFLGHIEQGFDVVYGERKDREEIAFVKLLRKIYYRVNRAAADEHFILDMAEFGVMNRMVREAIVADSSSYPYIRASVGRVGFDVKNVPYKRHRRIAGKTHYNIWRMSVFAVAGILASSTLWLRVPAFVFPFWAAATAACLAGLLATGRDLFFQLAVVGSLAFLCFSMTGVGLYLARVYKNGLNRPNYHINRKKSVLRGRTVS